MNMTILKPSIQSLHLEMEFDCNVISSGTGFVIQHNDKYYLITNRHNVTGRDNFTGEPLDKINAAIPNKIGIWHNKKNCLGSWEKKVESILTETGKPKWFEHPFLSAKADFVALPLTEKQSIDIYPYELEDYNEFEALNPTDIVSVIGFPFGLASNGKFAIWATGFIASELSIPYNNLPIFLIDCRTRQGQSGSAVVFHRNAGSFSSSKGLVLSKGPTTVLLGIYSGRIRPDSDLGMVWKKQAIKELLQFI